MQQYYTEDMNKDLVFSDVSSTVMLQVSMQTSEFYESKLSTC